MPDDQHIRHDDWRLGGEPHDAAPATSAAPPTQPIPLSEHRLDRRLFVVTVEHLGWAIVVVYAIVSRIIALAARPLGADEARRALLELASVRVAIPPDSALAVYPNWIDIAERWVFAAFGADDASARIVVALCGIILVVGALLMRNYIGRAGALALAAMLAFSPTCTYMARGGSGVVPVTAFMLVAIVLALSLGRAPSVPRAAAMGLAVALWLTAAPAGVITALTMLAALIPMGLWTIIVTDHRWLRLRVWWQRRRTVVLIAALAAIFAGYYLVTAMLSRPLLDSLFYAVDALQPLRPWSFAPGLSFYLPALAFYEFLIVILAIVGVGLSIVAVRTRLAAFAIIWTIVNTAVFLAMPARQMEFLAPILLPLALVGAIGVDSLAMSAAWPVARVVIAALGLLTLYIATLVNFIYAAPNASEAAWRRHLLLYWIEPATTLQTRHECLRVLTTQAGNSPVTVWVPPDAPQVSWYLNAMPVAPDRGAAQVAFSPAPATAGEPGTRRFGLEESWSPDPAKLTAAGAGRYLLSMHPWTDAVTYRDLQVVVRVNAEQPGSAPTPVASATPMPAPSPAATAPPGPAPAAAGSPEAATTAEATNASTPTPTASSAPAPSQIGSPAALPTSANL